MESVKRLRIYADTSVFGGCFDAEFEHVSRQFFLEAQAGRFVVVISDVTTRELQEAPLHPRPTLNTSGRLLSPKSILW
jgi:hypothetical protein